MKSAAGVAPLTAGGVAHAKAPEKALPKFDMDCDVLVVGLGLAGEGAAIAAARAGAKVIVVDKRVRTLEEVPRSVFRQAQTNQKVLKID